jgi:hypothetical protein
LFSYISNNAVLGMEQYDSVTLFEIVDKMITKMEKSRVSLASVAKCKKQRERFREVYLKLNGTPKEESFLMHVCSVFYQDNSSN